MKTKALKKEEIKRDWYLIDAENVRLGKLASEVSSTLIGKSKVTVSPGMDNGDFVVIINAEKISVHPKKLIGKKYYRHSGYIGSLKEETLKEKLSKSPEEVLRLAISGMLPKNKLRAKMLKRLHIYKGETHSHEAQSPQKIEISE